jgi:hypothetical protein
MGPWNNSPIYYYPHIRRLRNVTVIQSGYATQVLFLIPKTQPARFSGPPASYALRTGISFPRGAAGRAQTRPLTSKLV